MKRNRDKKITSEARGAGGSTEGGRRLSGRPERGRRGAEESRSRLTGSRAGGAKDGRVGAEGGRLKARCGRPGWLGTEGRLSEARRVAGSEPCSEKGTCKIPSSSTYLLSLYSVI